MRINITTIQEKMDQLLETMMAITQKERAAEMEVGAKKIASQVGTSGLFNQDDNFTRAKGVPIHILVGNEYHIELSDASAQHGYEVAEDDQYDAFYILDPPKPKVLPDPAAKRLCTLENKVKAIEDTNIFGSASMNMRLVSNLVIPSKFKTPDFEKYKGQTFPRSHLVMYFRKIVVHTKNDKLLIRCFQDNLSGASLRWYMSLEQGRIRSWEDLDDTFLRQYKYILDTTLDRMQ